MMPRRYFEIAIIADRLRNLNIVGGDKIDGVFSVPVDGWDWTKVR